MKFNGISLVNSMLVDRHTYYEVRKLSRENSPNLIRTYLANERTFLAFIRTALTLFVVGVSFIRFFDVLALDIIGWIFVPLGLVTFLVGLVRYIRMKLLITAFKRARSDSSTNQETEL